VNPLTGVFGEAWELYKAHWRHFFSIAFVVFVLLAVIGILLTALLGWLGIVIGAFISIAGTFWLQGALIQAVSDVRDGRADLSVSETFSQVYPKLWTIVGTGILLGIAIAIGLALLIVPGLYLMTIWIAVIPAIVLENRSIGEAFGRSRELVRGYGWNVFGTIVVTVLILIGVGIAVGLLLSPLVDWLASLIQQIVANTIVTPFVVAVWTLVYYRLKGREEGAPAESPPEPEPEPGAAV
jgi:Membrane domain of glycerophosphoryl diester phosphodiesterase